MLHEACKIQRCISLTHTHTLRYEKWYPFLLALLNHTYTNHFTVISEDKKNLIFQGLKNLLTNILNYSLYFPIQNNPSSKDGKCD